MLFSFLLWMNGGIWTITPKQKYWFWLHHALSFPIKVFRTVRKYFIFLFDGIHQSGQNLKLNLWRVTPVVLTENLVLSEHSRTTDKSFCKKFRKDTPAIWSSVQFEMITPDKEADLLMKTQCFLLFRLTSEWGSCF